MEKKDDNLTDGFINDVKGIIDDARKNAVRSVDHCRVQMYWNIGRRIFEEEQHGKERAEYGKYLIKNLANKLVPEYGSGFSVRTLEQSRQFYRMYPIANALRSQLNWTQYRKLIQIDNPDKREYYELESVNNGWNGREMERQINSQLYERLLLSNDKESVLSVANGALFRTYAIRPYWKLRLREKKWTWFATSIQTLIVIVILTFLFLPSISLSHFR